MDCVLHDVSTIKIAASEMASSGLLAARLIDCRLVISNLIQFSFN